MIVCDTRERKNECILKYFEENEIPYIQKKLDVGDYMDSERMDVSIDRKRNLGELVKNMLSHDKIRFWKEIRRASRAGIRLIVLCEHGEGYKRMEDVSKYKDRHSKASGRSLMNEMQRAKIAYGVEFLFCDRVSAGRRILELLSQ